MTESFSSEAVAAKRIDRSNRCNPSGTVLIATINREIGDTGVHAHTRSLTGGLRDAGQRVEVVSAFGGSRAWLGIFAFRRMGLDFLNASWSTRWHRHWHRIALRQNLHKRCKATTPAAVIAQCPLSLAAAISVRDQLGLSFPVVGVCHFNHSEATEYREKGELGDESAFLAMLDFEQQTFQAADAIVYVSEFARKSVEGERGIRPRRSAVIWNGIDAADQPAALERQSLGLSNDDVAIVNVGTLEARKNQLGLLDLFAALVRVTPHAKLLLVGEGSDRVAIEKKVAAMGLSDRVALLGFRRDVPSILAASDLYLHYAKLENCPVVLLEAARAGLPIATLPAGGAAEVLAALGAGVLLNEDPQGSASKLTLLVENAAVRKQIGAASAQGYAKRFTREGMTAAYLDVIDACAAIAGKGAA